MAPYLALERLDGRPGHTVAWALLRELYRREIGGELPEIAYGPHGKPDFAAGPWHFSLAHSTGHAGAVIASRPVGLDIEEAGRIVRPALAQRILSPRERERLAGATDPAAFLLAAWVLKEATVKAAGGTVLAPLPDVDIRPGDPRVKTWDGCVYATVTGE